MPNKTNKEIKFISPEKKPIKIDGKLSYAESQRAWGIIRFKKEILSEFSQLKRKRESFGYQMIFCRNKEDFEKQLKEIMEKGLPIPVLLWFYRK